MRIVVVCTGNVARSPALGWLLAERLHWPRWQIASAAVGKNAVSGLRMRRHMRDLVSARSPQATAYAEEHRSQLLADVPVPDLYVAVAPGHMKRLEELAPEVPRVLTVPAIRDPGFGGAEDYMRAWREIQMAVDLVDTWLPGM